MTFGNTCRTFSSLSLHLLSTKRESMMAHQQGPADQDSITRDTAVSDLSPHGLTPATSEANSPAPPPYSLFPSQTKPRISQPSSAIQQADLSNPFHSTTVSSSTTTSSSSFATVGTPARTQSQTHTLSHCVTPATTLAPHPTPAPTPPVATATSAPAQLQAPRPQSLFIPVQAPAHEHAQSDPLAYWNQQQNTVSAVPGIFSTLALLNTPYTRDPYVYASMTAHLGDRPVMSITSLNDLFLRLADLERERLTFTQDR